MHPLKHGDGLKSRLRQILVQTRSVENGDDRRDVSRPPNDGAIDVKVRQGQECQQNSNSLAPKDRICR
jgi:hypothetical protein